MSKITKFVNNFPITTMAIVLFGGYLLKSLLRFGLDLWCSFVCSLNIHLILALIIFVIPIAFILYGLIWAFIKVFE